MHPTVRRTALGLAVFAAAMAGANLAQPYVKPWMQSAQAALAEVFAASDVGTPVDRSAAIDAALALPPLAPTAGSRPVAAHPAALHQQPRGTGLVVPARAPAATAMRLSLLVDGAAGPIHADAPVALPDGARFRLTIRSDEAAELSVHAVNPQGLASATPLWTARVAARQAVATPRLRLEGTRGMETLRVVHRSLVDGRVTEQVLQVLHS